MQRSVVVGANGFIGSRVVRRLLDEGHSVLAFDVSRDFAAFDHTRDERLEFMTGDFLNRADLKAAVQRADNVVHLVSTTIPSTAEANKAFDVRSNVAGSIELFEECAAAGVRRVVFASSGGTVYGNPDSLPVSETAPVAPAGAYGTSKLFVEHYGALFESRGCFAFYSLRIGNPYGPGHHGREQGIVPIWLRAVHEERPVVIWGDGSVVRDYVFVDDVAAAFARVTNHHGRHRVFNVGSGVGHSVHEIVEQIRRVTGKPFLTVYEPGRTFDIPRIVLDVGLAARELDWRPRTSFVEGMSRTWRDIVGLPPPTSDDEYLLAAAP